jgi:hypothetical protein
VSLGRGDEAHELLGEAQATFEQLRATPWVERVDAQRFAEQVEA